MLGPPLRRLLHVYWRFVRGMTVGVRAVVLDGQGRVFLVRHSYIAGWHLPGGGVERGESVRDALARELREEGNIELAGPPELHGVFYNRRVSRRDHVVLFVVRNFHQPGPPVPNLEVTEHGFFPPDALPPDTTTATHTRLAEVLRAAPVSAWW